MIVRKATQDDAQDVASLILLAMRDIVYRFIGDESDKKANAFMKRLVGSVGNQYSWENCWVMVIDEEIVAAACVYNGADLYRLRLPVLNELKRMFDSGFVPEDETQEGEYYIDSIGVAPYHQGKGIGSKLVRFLIGEYVTKQKYVLGLLVDQDNPDAKKLYLRLGFETVGGKMLTAKPMEHMQCKPMQR